MKESVKRGAVDWRAMKVAFAGFAVAAGAVGLQALGVRHGVPLFVFYTGYALLIFGWIVGIREGVREYRARRDEYRASVQRGER